jgi:pimeloyl-ACP methyl ester carboxylesterase
VKITLDSGISLAYDSVGQGARTLVFAHGLGCDRTTMQPQVEAFSDRYRIVNVDLRGHGESDQPSGPYHPDVMAQDLFELCTKLGVDKPFFVAHSLGGVVGLRLAHLQPDLLAGLIALDSAIAVTPEVIDFTPSVVDRLRGLDGEEYRQTLAEILEGFFKPTDDPHRRELIIKMMVSSPKDVFLSGWIETVVHTDSLGPLASLAVPTLYVAAENSNGGLDEIRSAAGVTVGQTIGTGHFIEVECPDQVNAMINRFLVINDFA